MKITTYQTGRTNTKTFHNQDFLVLAIIPVHPSFLSGKISNPVSNNFYHFYIHFGKMLPSRTFEALSIAMERLGDLSKLRTCGTWQTWRITTYWSIYASSGSRILGYQWMQFAFPYLLLPLQFKISHKKYYSDDLIIYCCSAIVNCWMSVRNISPW